MKIIIQFFVALVKRGTKSETSETCFETLLQNKLNSDDARFTILVQACLATNQIIAN